MEEQLYKPEFLKNKMPLLNEALEKIEIEMEADIVSLHGFISEHLVDCFINLVYDLQKKPRNNKLAIILTTEGGNTKALKDLYEKLIKIYSHIDIIIPQYAYSAGTVLAFLGTNMYVEKNTQLGAIDPIIESSGISVFNCFAPGDEVELIQTNSLGGCLKMLNEKLAVKNDVWFPYHANILKEAVTFSYKLLTEHNLKEKKEKEKKAISIICYAMDIKKHPHHDAFHYHVLVDQGLNVKTFDENGPLNPLNVLGKLVMEYHREISEVKNKLEYYMYIPIGHNVNFLLHSTHSIEIYVKAFTL